MADQMVNSTNLDQYVYDVLKSMEGSADNQFKVSFDGDRSGMSFGYMQNDISAQGVLSGSGLSAKQVLQLSLQIYGVPASQADRLVGLASTAGISRNQFTAAELNLMQSALAANPTMISAQDQAAASATMGYVQSILDAASKFAGGPGVLDRKNLDPISLAYVAAWINRTGAPDTMTSALSVAASGKPLVLQDITNYLSGTTAQFTVLGENFSSYATRISTAVTTALNEIAQSGPIVNFDNKDDTLSGALIDIVGGID